MPKVLIVSIGTGPGVEHGIATSIRQTHPDNVLFLATKDSMDTIPKVQKELGKSFPHDQVILEDENDVERCYQNSMEAIRNLMAKGLSKAEMAADFTSGTKAMSAGLALAAVLMECESLVYVTGRRGSDGRVISGTERVISLTPTELMVDSKRRLIPIFFNAYQFSACVKVLDEFRDRVHDPNFLAEFDSLHSLVLAYDNWDRFDHQAAREYFQQTKGRDLKRWRINMEPNRRFLSQLLKSRSAYHETGNLEMKYSKEMAVDLLLNAERRKEEGRYDDAVGRLYRLVEFVAQLFLARMDLDTSQLEPVNLPESFVSRYLDIKEAKDKGDKVKIALERAYQLLKDLHHLAGADFFENNRLRHNLKARNDSILAHGIQPVSSNTFNELHREAVNLLKLAIGEEELERLKQLGKFASLELG